jgi:hypothetical protein
VVKKQLQFGFVISLWIWIISSSSGLQAQFRNPEDVPKTVYQLSGILVGKKNAQPAGYAVVRINHSRRGAIADEKGFYSIPVVPGDTLYFSCLGYKKTGFVFSDYLKDYQGEKETQFIYAIHYLEEDSVVLPTITIYPYDSPEKIRTAILAMGIPDGSPDDLARDNLDPEVMRYLMEELPRDGGESVSIGEKLYGDRVMAANKVATVPFFDPIAMGKFISYMSERSKQKKEKIYNFWPDEK